MNEMMLWKSISAVKLWLATGPVALYLSTEWLTGNVGLGLIASGFMSMITAIFVTRPKVIAARAAALVNTTASQDEHMEKLVRQLSEVHAREVQFWKDKVERLEKTEVLIRVTKHRLINSLQAANFCIRSQQDQLRMHGMPVEPFHFVRFAEITGDEDKKQISLLFGEQAEEAG